MQTRDRLLCYGKKTITKDELKELLCVSQDEALFPVIEELQNTGLLQPVKASKTNGNRQYPIYMKYKIILPKNTFEAELTEIETLHPMLQSSGYLRQKPEEYQKYRRQLQQLDQYLFREADYSVAVSRKERSFEIFSQEKELDNRTFCAFLEKLGLNRQTLHFYDTPEYCFNDYIPRRKSCMTLLICENKDTWFNLRRMMFEEHASVLFGTELDGVVYGCGNKVTQAGALKAYTDFMGGSQVQYLYWGDIDREGFNIYLRLAATYPELSIALFVPAYEAMLRLAKGRTIPDSSDKRELQGNYEPIYRAISQELRADLQISIQTNKRLPQEIVSYTELKKNME